jgi:hypothetical protein
VAASAIFRTERSLHIRVWNGRGSLRRDRRLPVIPEELLNTLIHRNAGGGLQVFYVRTAEKWTGQIKKHKKN